MGATGPERLVGDCYNKFDCPAVYERSATTVIVQGYLVDRVLPSDRGAVEVPAQLLLDAAERWRQRHPSSQPTRTDDAGSSIERTASGTLIVEGALVQAIELPVPAGEAAVAVTVRVLIDALEEVADHAA